MDDYDFRPVETGASELQTIADLFSIVWPEATHLTADYTRWLYVDNPSGPVIGTNAWAGDTLAGHYVVIPIRAAFHGESVTAALSLNTVVHPKHQGRGLFTRLAHQTYELAAARGVHHIIGVANANSTPGFLRKLDFKLVQPLAAHVLWRWPTIAPEAGDTKLSWRRIWEPDDLAWRLRNPVVKYGMAMRRGCRQITAPTGKCGIQAVLKVEDVTDAAELTGVKLSPPPALRMKLWMGLSPRVRLPAAGSVTLPERLRASPLNLVIRYLVPDTKPITADTVHFEAIDFDAY